MAQQQPQSPPVLHIEGGRFLDHNDREVILRGINFAGDAKFPYHENSSSYVDSPCPLDQLDSHLIRLKKLGFNTIRYLFTWDALENKGPGIYDDEYIDYTIEMLRKIRDHGFYIFMDPHQDVWSRFSGGSGAPLWTLHAAGLNPEAFEDTHAAMLYDKESVHRVKMIWASNYHRLVSQTMFTLFFAGEQYAPKCEINGVNVGTYLYDHYMNAMGHFVARVKKADIGHQLLGWESMNEPGHGLIAYGDLSKHPDEYGHVKLGTSPTPFQAMMLGQGVAQSVDFYRFTALGLRKEDTISVAPTRSTWFTPEELATIDAQYNWKRSWGGGCIWELHDVYSKERSLLKIANYFQKGVPITFKNESAFVEHYFMKHWDDYRKLVESNCDQWFVFMQAPVNLPPPDLVKRGHQINEARTVYTPHYYDGLTLLLKRWRWMNVDAVGVCRNHYASPVLALKVGNRAIRNSFDSQLAFLKSEGIQRVGKVPVLISEIGIPYDMDRKRAYDTGYYDDQVQAMDANHHALESAQLSHTLWVYTVQNTHKYGDLWCGEDLSIWSLDDINKNGLDHSDPASGVRAAPAVIRPTPVAVNGSINSYSFDIYKSTFTLALSSDGDKTTTNTHPTTIYLPAYYFGPEPRSVVTSSGTFEIKDGLLTWYHAGGPQMITIRGSPRFADALYSYVDPLVKFASNAAKEASALFRKRPLRN